MVTAIRSRAPVALALCSVLWAGTFPYRQALPGYRYEFPRDLFEHNDFQTEWWYYTGNVWDAGGARFGFELVFFRQGDRHQDASNSAWDIQQLYLAHAAVTDARGHKFLYQERLNRAGPGVAGASFAAQKIWNGNWQSTWNGQKQTLRAIAPGFRFDIRLSPEKPLVIHGANGVSQKAQGVGRASHYISFPRLRAEGNVEVNGAAHNVHGTAWMDHEWFTNQLTTEQQGWDWFSIQLEDGTELMLGELRRKDGSIDPASSGTFVDRDGKPRHLTRPEFQLTPIRGSGRYPTEWKISVPSLNLELTCRAVIPGQELRPASGGPSYWEGAVDYSGSKRGVGYLEMTGYLGAARL